MIGLVQPDRWTCPTCHRTVIPKVRSDAELPEAIRCAQLRHGRRHAHALEAAAYLAAVHAGQEGEPR